jgi:hypothetical protein
LRQRHLSEGLDVLADDFRSLEKRRAGDGELHLALSQVLEGRSASDYFQKVRRDLLTDRAPQEALGRIINLLLLTVAADSASSEKSSQDSKENAGEHVPVTSVY